MRKHLCIIHGTMGDKPCSACEASRLAADSVPERWSVSDGLLSPKAELARLRAGIADDVYANSEKEP